MTEREAALLANPEVLEALKRGIAQAKAGDYIAWTDDERDALNADLRFYGLAELDD
jgi:PHD/YefM family antitoxin component YafN of YafNO toxin-antitoxin module